MPGGPESSLLSSDALQQQVHVWLLFAEQRCAMTQSEAGVLSAADSAEAGMLPTEALRRRFRAARWALRNVLSLHADTPPADWVFQRNPWGRPEVCCADGGLRFSLSYGEGMTALAVARSAEVGVDIVSAQRDVDVLGLAEFAFAASETAQLRSMDGGAARERFFDLWALKEAYAKALGTGFWDKPRHFAFEFPAAGEIGFRPEAAAQRAKWQFVLASAPLGHRLAVAVESSARRPPHIVARVWPGGETCTLRILAQGPNGRAMLSPGRFRVMYRVP